ncbi:MAG: DNA/RNA non-specific endonuclease [Lachnospiraceae bacterium]|nr:DNA/RNA non-specific endonuclease [Lachnospiraceae bacterium]
MEQALIASVNSDGAGNNIPAYSGSPYIIVNNNVPFFDATQYNSQAFETYSELDTLGRCGVAFANVGKEIMPTGERGSIGSVKPTGWHTVKYDNVDGKYLYNRCHLIGYQLSGENANKQNLITGTRYMNVDGMLPFENMVADYVKETNNHVLYRVTPVFDGNNLVAGGVLMEAQSIEDDGSGVKFCVYCYNIQPGISIDYATGDSKVGDPVSAQADIGAAVADAGASANVPQTEAPTQPPTAAPTQPQTEAPTVAPTQPQDTGNSTLVWLSETGEKYHSINNCGRMNPDKAYQVTQEQAEAMGKGRCSKCW